jgi:hypothetical protein
MIGDEDLRDKEDDYVRKKGASELRRDERKGMMWQEER